jgi:hypothetical protein
MRDPPGPTDKEQADENEEEIEEVSKLILESRIKIAKNPSTAHIQDRDECFVFFDLTMI